MTAQSSTRSAPLAQACLEWDQVVGREHVLRESLERYNTATFPTDCPVPVVVRPASTAEVSQVLRIAARHQVPMHPISLGYNIGYGCRVPYAPGTVVMDLQRMNRIVDFDEDLAVVTVEPGVSFSALQDFLTKQHSRWWMPGTGLGGGASVIGNVADRGHGVSAAVDRFSRVCDLEVVLPNGEVLQTGSRRLGPSRISHLQKWGNGPYTEGLFTQSNLGLITRASVWLLPRPQAVHVVIFEQRQQDRIAPIVDALRSLVLDGIIGPGSGGFANIHRNLLGYATKLSDDERARVGRMSDDEARAALRRFGSSAYWVGAAVVDSFVPGDAGARAREVVRRLRPLTDRTVRFSPFLYRVGKAIGPILRKLTGFDLSPVLEGYETSLGVVTPLESEAMVRAGTGGKEVGHLDTPGLANCGFIWTSHQVPARGSDYDAAWKTIVATSAEFGFSPVSTGVQSDARVFSLPTAVFFDMADKERSAAAMGWHRTLSRRLMDQGYPPWKLGVASDQSMVFADPLTLVLRQHFDPHGLLSPGRLPPR